MWCGVEERKKEFSEREVSFCAPPVECSEVKSRCASPRPANFQKRVQASRCWRADWSRGATRSLERKERPRLGPARSVSPNDGETTLLAGARTQDSRHRRMRLTFGSSKCVGVERMFLRGDTLPSSKSRWQLAEAGERDVHAPAHSFNCRWAAKIFISEGCEVVIEEQSLNLTPSTVGSAFFTMAHQSSLCDGQHFCPGNLGSCSPILIPGPCKGASGTNLPPGRVQL